MLREGTGVDLVGLIREADHAVVFISVPWSGPERHGRQAFYDAAANLAARYPALDIAFFRLDVVMTPHLSSGSSRSAIPSSL
jgi:hypothetical protein